MPMAHLWAYPSIGLLEKHLFMKVAENRKRVADRPRHRRKRSSLRLELPERDA